MRARVWIILPILLSWSWLASAQEDPTVGPMSRLADPNADVRLAAVRDLAKLEAAAAPAVDALLDRVRTDPDHDVQALSIVALGRIGAGALAALPEMQMRLRDPDGDLGGWAATALARIDPENAGGRVTAALLIALTDPLAALRAEAAAALGFVRKDARTVVIALAEQLAREDDGLVRGNVKQALFGMGTRAMPGLLPLLDNKDESIRHFAAEALGKIGPEAEAAAPDLIRALRHDCSRGPFIQALTRIGGGAVPALLEALRTGDAATRPLVVDVLHDIQPVSPEAVTGLLNAAMDDPAAGVRHAAIRAVRDLDPLGATALPALIQALAADGSTEHAMAQLAGAESHPGRRIGAAEAVAAWGPDAQVAIPALQKMTASSAKIEKIAALSALCRLDPASWVPKALPDFLAGMREAAADIRARAVEALASLGPAAEPAVPELIAMLAYPALMEHAVRVLGAIGPGAKKALPELQKALEEKQRWMRTDVENALRNIGGR